MKRDIKVIAFDAYGTLFNLHSVVALCDRKFPGRGVQLSGLWRAKQLEYTWLRSLSGQYEDFWMVTESALAFACRSLNLACPTLTREELMESYLLHPACAGSGRGRETASAGEVDSKLIEDSRLKGKHLIIHRIGLKNE